MAFTLDSGGFYQPPSFPSILSPFWCFGTRSAPVPEGPAATLHQVHSARVIRAEEPGVAGEGDALITNIPGLALGIKSADCFPLLMVDLNHRAVAAVHAGWRGTAQRIGPAAIRAMREEYGTEAHGLHVAIGPGIGPCCFEVGPEVAREFAEYKKAPPTRLTAVSHIDLPAVNREQLEAAGVPGHQIYEAGLCTMCRPEEFFSYRREREQAGRMFSWIRIEK